MGNLTTRLDAFARREVRPAFGGRAQRVDLGRADVAQLHSVVASYSGHLRHGRAMRAWNGVWQRHPWLAALFERRGWAFDERWPERAIARARCFRSQYWELVRRAGEHCLVFCRVGRFIEFRGPQRALAERVLGLKRAYLPRAGLAFAAGFPAWLARRYEARALSQGHAVAVVRETGERPGACRERRPVAVLIPAPS